MQASLEQTAWAQPGERVRMLACECTCVRVERARAWTCVCVVVSVRSGARARLRAHAQMPSHRLCQHSSMLAHPSTQASVTNAVRASADATVHKPHTCQ
eukprot:2667382-Pleurochrysis_carterae.AAC.1